MKKKINKDLSDTEIYGGLNFNDRINQEYKIMSELLAAVKLEIYINQFNNIGFVYFILNWPVLNE